MKNRYNDLYNIANTKDPNREAQLETAIQSMAEHGSTLNSAYSLSRYNDTRPQMPETRVNAPFRPRTTFGPPGSDRSDSRTPDRFYPIEEQKARWLSVAQSRVPTPNETSKLSPQEVKSRALEIVEELRELNFFGPSKVPDDVWRRAIYYKAVMEVKERDEAENDEEDDDEEE